MWDRDIEDYLNASNNAIDTTYNSMWEKIADKVRQHFASRGISVSGEVEKALVDSQKTFTDAVARAKAQALADAYRLQAGRNTQREQQRWYDEQTRQQYADYNSYMNRMNMANAFMGAGGGAGDMGTHDDRWKAFSQQNPMRGMANYYDYTGKMNVKPGGGDQSVTGVPINWPGVVTGSFTLPNWNVQSSWRGEPIRQWNPNIPTAESTSPYYDPNMTPGNTQMIPAPWRAEQTFNAPSYDFNPYPMPSRAAETFDSAYFNPIGGR